MVNSRETITQKEILEKEIDLLQACINRMAQNSFSVKGWTIALSAVILALLPERVNLKLLSITAMGITLCLWYLDAYYLRLERLYRWKYQWVIENRLTRRDFCFDLNPDNEHMWGPTPRKAPKIFCVMCSKTLLPIYGTLFLLSSVVFLFQIFCQRRCDFVIFRRVGNVKKWRVKVSGL